MEVAISDLALLAVVYGFSQVCGGGGSGVLCMCLHVGGWVGGWGRKVVCSRVYGGQ